MYMVLVNIHNWNSAPRERWAIHCRELHSSGQHSEDRGAVSTFAMNISKMDIIRVIYMCSGRFRTLNSKLILLAGIEYLLTN